MAGELPAQCRRLETPRAGRRSGPIRVRPREGRCGGPFAGETPQRPARRRQERLLVQRPPRPARAPCPRASSDRPSCPGLGPRTPRPPREVGSEGRVRRSQSPAQPPARRGISYETRGPMPLGSPEAGPCGDASLPRPAPPRPHAPAPGAQPRPTHPRPIKPLTLYFLIPLRNPKPVSLDRNKINVISIAIA